MSTQTTLGTSARRGPALVALLLIAAYVPGLFGPFVLDDHINLLPVWVWHAGSQDWHATVFDNASGPGGRPLAYLSFMLNAWIGGTSPFGFKLLNVVLHLLIAWLAWNLMQMWLRGLQFAEKGPSVAGIIAALWALHPIHVSSVLYTVQRMTLLAALAQLGGVCLYLFARERLETSPRLAIGLLSAGVPLVLAAGVLAKETAVLGIALIVVVELSLGWRTSRSKPMWVFLSVAVCVPAAVLALALAMDPDWVQRGYLIREFTLEQRAMSIGRILADYALAILAPLPSQLALYRDGFPLSTSWISPPATLLTWLGWLAVLATSLWKRRSQALVAAGLLWFLASHALESTVLALEPQFEHRNYLASLGLLMAIAGLLLPAIHRLRTSTAHVVIVIVLVALGSATAMRTWNWADLDRLLLTEGPAHQISRRLQVDRAIRGLDRGDSAARNAALATLRKGNKGDRASAALWTVLLSCAAGERDAMSGALPALLADAPPQATHNQLSALGLLVRESTAGRCALPRDTLLSVVDAWRRQPATQDNADAQQRLGHYRGQLTMQQEERP